MSYKTASLFALAANVLLAAAFLLHRIIYRAWIAHEFGFKMSFAHTIPWPLLLITLFFLLVYVKQEQEPLAATVGLGAMALHMYSYISYIKDMNLASQPLLSQFNMYSSFAGSLILAVFFTLLIVKSRSRLLALPAIFYGLLSINGNLTGLIISYPGLTHSLSQGVPGVRVFAVLNLVLLILTMILSLPNIFWYVARGMGWLSTETQ